MADSAQELRERRVVDAIELRGIGRVTLALVQAVVERCEGVRVKHGASPFCGFWLQRA